MSPRAAILAYTALSLILTWPLALGLGRDVPGDLGDSLLNMWILAWGAEHLPRLLTGGVSWTAFWNANIFHPEPLGLTFSEHLFGQTLQILPVYWLTGNVILCYNLLFISTFALSAFGAFLLARELTGDWRAGFVAGLVYGFLPYRIGAIPHLQVLSSQWMPFALYGLSRFVTTGSRRALAGGTAALVMQNWSCGYYLLYFAPFVPTFVIHRMWTSAKLTDMKTWASLAVAAAATLMLTLPFLWPYMEAQQRFGLERSMWEVLRFSANLWSYVTVGEDVRVWGSILRVRPHPEGETFLGFVPWILAIVAMWGLTPSVNTATQSRARRILIAILTIVAASQLVALVSAVAFGGFDVNLVGLHISASSPQRLLMQFFLAMTLLLSVSASARLTAARAWRSPLAFCAFATVIAIWLSLGPVIKAGDALVSGSGLYGVLYDYVPGFRGVRVPARYAMIAGLFLSVVSAYGVTTIVRRAVRRAGALAPAATFVIGLLVLLEGAAIPLTVNRVWAQDEAMPPARVYPANAAPAVYQRVAALPAGTAITEFPFGDPAWDIRFTYYSHVHWKPITNGYSGGFPPSYTRMVARLRNVATDPEASWRALVDSGTTHVVFHPAAFQDPAAASRVEAWLQSHGARLVETFADKDALYALP